MMTVPASLAEAVRFVRGGANTRVPAGASTRSPQPWTKPIVGEQRAQASALLSRNRDDVAEYSLACEVRPSAGPNDHDLADRARLEDKGIGRAVDAG
jgi:hypothetical protein